MQVIRAIFMIPALLLKLRDEAKVPVQIAGSYRLRPVNKLEARAWMLIETVSRAGVQYHGFPD